MALDFPMVVALVRETLLRPRDAAMRLLRMGVPDDGRWLIFVLVVVLSVIMAQLSILLMGEEGALGGSLFAMALFQSAVLMALVMGVQGFGRMFGGTGGFPDTLLLVAWVQFVMLAFQAVQLAVLVIAPPLFGIVTLLSVLVFLRSLTIFVQVLHGFDSALKVGVGILFAFFAVAFAMAVVLGLLGVLPVPEGV